MDRSGTLDVNTKTITNGAIAAATLGADCITEAKIADNAIAAEHIANAAIDNATFAADVGSTAYATNIIALAVRKVLDELNLDHLLKTAVANNADMTTEVTDGSVVSNMISKTSDTSTYTVADDSHEAIADAASGDLTKIMGTSLTEGSSGRLAASFIKFNDVATPTKDINDVGAVASGGVPKLE